MDITLSVLLNWFFDDEKILYVFGAKIGWEQERHIFCLY